VAALHWLISQRLRSCRYTAEAGEYAALRAGDQSWTSLDPLSVTRDAEEPRGRWFCMGGSFRFVFLMNEYLILLFVSRLGEVISRSSHFCISSGKIDCTSLKISCLT
jgi:hypothetical protein